MKRRSARLDAQPVPTRRARVVEPAQAVASLRKPGIKRVAVFLGAGAARPLGYPLTSDFLHEIILALVRDRDRTFLTGLKGDPSHTGAENRRLLLNYLTALLPGESLRDRNLPLVTTLLSLLDYSLATGQSVLPSQSAERTRQARRLLERGILEVIADEQPFGHRARRLLESFRVTLADLRQRAGRHALPVITTNYDLATDEAVFRCANIPGVRWWNEEAIAARIDFGFPWLHPDADPVRIYRRPPDPEFQILKLHGSTNWLRCPLCDNVYIDPWGPIWNLAYRTKPDHRSICHCSDTQLEAQIVSPSFVREMRAANLLSVWKAALDSLRASDAWLIVGYSFPDEDLAIRALFTRAYGAKDTRPQVTVVQLGDESRNRFEAFFEPSLLSFCASGFEPFLEAWAHHRGTRAARRTRAVTGK